MLENHDPDNDLYQWRHGSKLCSGILESLISLEDGGSYIEVKARGPTDSQLACFYFLDDIMGVVEAAIQDVCPNLYLQKLVLSAADLAEFETDVEMYTNSDVVRSQMEKGFIVSNGAGSEEHLLDLLCFGATDVLSVLTLSIDLPISHLSLQTKHRLAAMLDPPDPLGKDWCLLGVALGLNDMLPSIDKNSQLGESKTNSVLAEWSRDESATIGNLIEKLQELGRNDAADIILSTAPLYRMTSAETSEQQAAEVRIRSLSSDLSRLSR